MSSTKIGMPEIKQNNRQFIYNYIRKHSGTSKQDMVKKLNLSLPTVTQNVNYLLSQGLIYASKKIEHTGGRNAIAFSFAKNAKVAIGVYPQEHQMNIVAVNLSGDVIAYENVNIRFDLDDEAYLRKIGEGVELVKARAETSDDQLLGVGISVPGLVSEDGENVIYGQTLGFTGKTRAQIARYVPYPNRLFHDSYTAGLCEVFRGNSTRNAFYLNLNNTVGGSVVIDHHLYDGDTRKGGEIGHVTLVHGGGKKCYCGKYGCIDTVCRAGCLDSYTGGDLNKFFSLLKWADAGAQALWDQYLDYLSQSIHIIRMLFDCPIILGGRVGSYIGRYMDDLNRRVDAQNPFGDQASTYLSACQYTTDAVAAGAAMSYINQFFHSI